MPPKGRKGKLDAKHVEEDFSPYSSVSTQDFTPVIKARKRPLQADTQGSDEDDDDNVQQSLTVKLFLIFIYVLYNL